MSRKRFLSLLAFLLACIMPLSMISCNNGANSTDETTIDEESEENTPDDRYVYKHVVIVGIDGAGAFFKNTDTPNLDAIFENGAVTYEAITATPSISAQSWGSLLTGVTPDFHGLDNNITGTNAYPSDSIFP
ncbi:MAG: alkaline phosphatase family protein, partial [Clostridia bacterium]|nr:alkaline phosphatase family protein [Clostridia bacterium]